jgi:hypothetical protein
MSQNENPTNFSRNILKEANGSLNYSNNNQFRVFGKELTNLPLNQENINKSQTFKPTGPKKTVIEHPFF